MIFYEFSLIGSLQKDEMCIFSIPFALYVTIMYEHISSCKFCSAITNIIPYDTSACFQEVCWVTQPLLFHQRRNIFSWNRVNSHKIIDF